MSNSVFAHSIAAFIKSNRLMDKEKLYLLALSGGADSVALLCVLSELGYRVEAIHCNFHLRGEESNRDEAFCNRLCQQRKIPLHLASFDTTSFAQLHKISIEMAARRLRYHYFTQLCNDLSADGVCVGHHADDQVETILLNLIRGTGIDGLTGMKPCSGNGNSNVIRPMLTVSRKQILAYLQSLGQDYVTDSTNLVDDVQRNQVRLDVLPLLERINPAVKRNILHMAENLSEVRLALDDQLEAAKGEAIVVDKSTSPTLGQAAERKMVTFDVGRLMAFPSPELLFWRILAAYGFNRSQVGEIVRFHREGTGNPNDDRSLKLWQSADDVALSDGCRLHIVAREVWDQPFNAFKIPECGLYRKDNLSCRVEELSIDMLDGISRAANKITIDRSKVAFPLMLRRVEVGDKFTPYGLHGHKLVSDFLKDAHLNPVARRHQLVLADATGQIIWLVGLRIDDRCKIVKGKTLRVLQIEIDKK